MESSSVKFPISGTSAPTKVRASLLTSHNVGQYIFGPGLINHVKTMQWWEISMVTYGRNGKVKVHVSKNGLKDYTFDAEELITISPYNPIS